MERMTGERRVVQAMDWIPEGKRGRGRPRKNRQETIICEDIRCMDMTWREVFAMAENREGWSDCVARYAEMHGKV